MVKQFAGTITSFLVHDNIITEEEREIYQYGTEQIIINFIVVLVLSIFAYYLKIWMSTFFWLLGILPIRVIAGGFHASTRMRCNLLTLSIYLVNIAIINFLLRHMTFFMLVATLFVIVFCIFKFAPVDHKNRMLDRREYLIAKRNSRIVGIVIFVVCMSAATICSANNIVTVSMVVGALTASISLVIGSFRRGGEMNDKVEIFS